MRRRILVETRTPREARAIERALVEPDVRAFAVIVGELAGLGSTEARARVLRYMTELVSAGVWATEAAPVNGVDVEE